VEALGKAVAVKVAEVQNLARHVLRIALVLWLSAELRAAPESAVQPGRGDEGKLVNRQAEMIDPAKCRKGYASAAVSKIKN
jgi:glycine/D-amino acid oxidase-like deaminating enzyme